MDNEAENREQNELYRRAEQAVSEKSLEMGREGTELISALLRQSRGLEYEVNGLRRTHAALDELRRQLTDLFDFAPVGYFVLDGQANILSLNITACDMLGQSRDKLTNTSFHNLVTPQSHDRFLAYLQEIAQTGQRLSTEVQLASTSGKAFDAQLQTVALYQKSLLTYRVSVADISERKKVETELRNSEKRYHLLFENMLDGFAYCKMVYDDQRHPVDFTYLNVNNAFETLTGLKNVVGRRVTDVIPGIIESHPELFAAYSRVALTGVPERFEIEFKPLDSWFDISVYSTEKEHFVSIFDNITQRKRSEQALAESTKRFRDLADSFPEIIFETDLRGNVSYLNDKGLDIFGLSAADMASGINVFDYVSPRDRGFATERFTRTLQQGDVGRDEFLLLHQDETAFPALVHTARIMRDGQAVGVRGIVTDITQRKRVEESLRMYALILEDIADPVCYTDREFKVQFWNAGAERQYGWGTNEAIGKDVHELLGIEYQGQDRESALKQLWQQGNWRGEVRHHHKDGSPLDVLVSRSVLKDSSGNAIGIVMVSRDITERKRAEEALQASEKHLRSTLDSILEGCMIIDYNWRCVYANEAVALQGRFTKEQWVGRSITELLPGFEKTEIYACQKETMEKRVSNNMETSFTYPDGTERWFQISIRPVPEGILVLYLNISEHKTTEQRLKQGMQRLERIYGFTKLAGMQPTDLMTIEHRLIERVVAVLARQRAKMERTETVDNELIEYTVDFFRTYADMSHHGKEENIVFKKLATKSLTPEHREMLDQLLTEHEMARRLITNLGSARERWAAGDAGARQQLITAANGIIKLYPEHIDKEDNHFFPAIMKYFSGQEQEDMLLEFWEFDRQMIHLKYTKGVDVLTQPSANDIG